MKRLLREWLPFLAVLFVARGALADLYVVPSGSMEPTVQVDDRVLVDKRAYGLRLPSTQLYLARYATPAPGDVVVLDSPVDGRVLLKRVVASEGMTVLVRDGRVWLDGAAQPVADGREQLDGRSHAVSLAPDGGPDFGPTTVPKGKTLVMGDNRGNSFDGRAFGFVDNDAVLGRAQRIYWRDGALAWRPLD